VIDAVASNPGNVLHSSGLCAGDQRVGLRPLFLVVPDICG